MDPKKIEQYHRCIRASENVGWKINDVLPDDYEFRFDKPFLGEQLTLLNELSFLSPEEVLQMNHLRSASYVNLFAFVEEYITAQLIMATSKFQFEDNARLRALLRFSEEEVKHQTLFLKYLERFQENFHPDITFEFLSGASDIASIILSHSEAGVMFLTLHLELITQQHYHDSLENHDELDQQFVEMLKKHWHEEAQHSKLDAMELEEYLKDFSIEEQGFMFDEYLGLLDSLMDLLKVQVKMDYESLRKLSSSSWSSEEIEQFYQCQEYSYIQNFVLYGFENKIFRHFCEKVSPEFIEKIDQKRTVIRSEYRRD